MDHLLAGLQATAASYSIMKNGPEDSSHRRVAQEVLDH